MGGGESSPRMTSTPKENKQSNKKKKKKKEAHYRKQKSLHENMFNAKALYIYVPLPFSEGDWIPKKMIYSILFRFSIGFCWDVC